MPEESGCLISQLPPPCGYSLLSKRESFSFFCFSSTPPLSLEEVAFMPEESGFLMFFPTPSVALLLVPLI